MFIAGLFAFVAVLACIVLLLRPSTFFKKNVRPYFNFTLWSIRVVLFWWGHQDNECKAVQALLFCNRGICYGLHHIFLLFLWCYLFVTAVDVVVSPCVATFHLPALYVYNCPGSHSAWSCKNVVAICAAHTFVKILLRAKSSFFSFLHRRSLYTQRLRCCLYQGALYDDCWWLLSRCSGQIMRISSKVFKHLCRATHGLFKVGDPLYVVQRCTQCKPVCMLLLIQT